MAIATGTPRGGNEDEGRKGAGVSPALEYISPKRFPPAALPLRPLTEVLLRIEN